MQMPDGHYASCWMNVKKELEEEGRFSETADGKIVENVSAASGEVKA